MELISFEQAKSEGRSRYFTGKPCVNGHVAERYVYNKWLCCECRKILDSSEERKSKMVKYRANWEEANPQKAKEAVLKSRRNGAARHAVTNKEWRAKNKEHITATARAWRHRNPEKSRATVKRWIAKNPERNKVINAKRRAALKEAEGSYTLAEIRQLLVRQKHKCVNCHASLRDGYHADHIMPLSLGGSNYIENIQLLCQPCNNSKYNKHPIVWAQENGRLL